MMPGLEMVAWRLVRLLAQVAGGREHGKGMDTHIVLLILLSFHVIQQHPPPGAGWRQRRITCML
jgi:hypothetical protein